MALNEEIKPKLIHEQATLSDKFSGTDSSFGKQKWQKAENVMDHRKNILT